VLIVATFRFIIFLILAVSFIAQNIFVTDIDKRVRSVQKYCRLILKIFNIHVEYPLGQSPAKGRLIICNHLSYVDVLVLFAQYPSLFVTSVEIQETPFLGTLCKLGGCFFVERRKSKRGPGQIQDEISSMKSQLEKGRNVFLFPEGTSSDGTGVLPFKSSFFQAAIDCNSPIRPLCIKYDKIEAVAWYGDMGFISHLYKLCREPGINAVVAELDELEPLQSRFVLKENSFQLIREAYAQY